VKDGLFFAFALEIPAIELGMPLHDQYGMTNV
jgi:hypothetical protein